ncbi:MAG: hypothetical protein EOO71_03460 [Myxococcaceae bacterium]|nr:MAG: hypothetical protein EOO71_03460 [Myxococcaceae bacterium]
MGRIFETRKATMFARWNKMAKIFTRITKDIVIAVKAGGADPTSNSALRRAIQNARAANMPKNNVESAIKRASGQDQADYQIVLYETTGEKGEKQILLRCEFADFGKLQAAIEAKGITPLSAESEYIPLPGTLKELPEEQAQEVLKLVDMLEQDEDVQHVFHNLA